MPLLSDQDRAQFDEQGYVVIPNVVPQENCDNLIRVLFAFLEADPQKPETWYRLPVQPGGNVEIHQHQALWDNRQHPTVHQAFAEIFGDEKLWVSLDRAGFRPPQNPDYPKYQANLVAHWDMDVSKIDTAPFRVQGVLALVDTPAEVGGFTCVPGFHKIAADWIRSRPGQDSRVPDLSELPSGYELQPVPMKAGDLVIWNNKLLHGNGYNKSDRIRMAQYITMFPEQYSDEAKREERVRLWQERIAGPGWPGDERLWEQKNAQTAELTPLGRKLLGADAWE